MLHSAQLSSASTGDGLYDFRGFLGGIEDELREADLSVAGMEFTLGGRPYSGYPHFSAPEGYVDYLVDSCGVDVLLTANNHMLDRGQRGLERTLGELSSRGVLYTGSDYTDGVERNPLIVPVGGVRVAIINFTYGLNEQPAESALETRVIQQSYEQVLPLISRARHRGADIVIVCPHWGIEYELHHSSSQQRWAQALAEAGADAIIGAHPHVVQDRQTITTSDGRQVPIYYSLGNAVSNMSAPNTQLELMVTIRLCNRGLMGVELIDLHHQWLWCSRPGELSQGFRTVKVSDYNDSSLWLRAESHSKMLSTYRRVSEGF